MFSRLLVSAPPIFPGNNRYKELSGAHTFDVLADTMQQFYRAFDIEIKVILAINILFRRLFSPFFYVYMP